MTGANAVNRVLPGIAHPLLVAAPVALVAAAAAILLGAGHREAGSAVALAAAVAFGLVLHVDLPWGGRLTLGHAVLIALVSRAEPEVAIVVALAGIVLALPSWLEHADEGSLPVRLGGAVSVLAATAAALAARLALDLVDLDGFEPDARTMIVAAGVGVVFLVVDHGMRGAVAGIGGDRSELRQAASLYVTLLCVAILIDLAARRSLALAFVAAVPLLVTRFAFQRYTTARITYEQTTKALSLLPEVAGLTPLGHSERTAAYVEAVAPSLGFDAAKVSHLANAARLHHIGHISLHEEAERDGPPDPTHLAEVSEEILEQTGFLADLVELVKDSQPGGPPASSVEAAVIRVCSTLDDLVESGEHVDPFASLVALHPVGHERAVAIALLATSHRRPGLVAEARASVELIHQIAAKAEAAAHHDH